MRNSKFSSLFCLLIALSVGAMAGPAISQQSPPPDAPQPQNQGQQASQTRQSNTLGFCETKPTSILFSIKTIES
jgi:hypothetical protein